MSELDEKMDALLKLLKSERGQRRPIEGHPLKDKEPLTKNRYLSHLCAILLYKNAMSEAQRILLERLIAGIKTEHDAEDYLRMSLEITSESIAELIDRLKDDLPLKYAFALDALVLCHLQECGDDQAAFMAEMFDALYMIEADLTYLTRLGKALLTMNQEMLSEAVTLRPEYIDKTASAYYARLMGEEAVETVLRTTMKELRKIAEGGDFDSIISYATINAQNKEEFNNTFVYGGNITFSKCNFAYNKNGPLWFKNFHKVAFEDCTFSGFKTETILLDNVKEATFLRCEFTDCIKHYHNAQCFLKLGGVIKCNKGTGTEVDIDSCGFINCGGVNSDFYSSSSIISDGQIRRCVNNVFHNCWHYYYGTNKDPDGPKRVLFSHVAKEENNKVIDSARLC
ncbi:MAG: right-handed parallel beta-helix repeat-containing protein [Synergistaceae bacterium]|jgi:hypothetical protein|nr:right-handed parallel beta-helix repeat-containing protein [Synergistaceae bacterium]